MSDARVEDEGMRIGEPETSAVGVPGVVASMRYALSEMGPARSLRTLLRVNQAEGFDCPSCAWADPAVKRPQPRRVLRERRQGGRLGGDQRSASTRAFFAAHPVAFLREQTDHWLELQRPADRADVPRRGRRPLHADRLGRRVRGWSPAGCSALPDPNRAVFYTSGRASNEAAFAYQLLARRLGTNNLPDCSNMCHESSGAALSQTIGDRQGQGHPRGHLRAGRR